MGYNPFTGQWRDDEPGSSSSSSSRSSSRGGYSPFSGQFFGVSEPDEEPSLDASSSSRVYDEEIGGYVDQDALFAERGQESLDRLAEIREILEREEARKKLEELEQYKLMRDSGPGVQFGMESALGVQLPDSPFYGALGAGATAATGAALEGGLGLIRGLGTAGRQAGETFRHLAPGGEDIPEALLPGQMLGGAIEQGVDWLRETEPVEEFTGAAEVGRSLGDVPNFALDLAAQAPQLAAAAVVPTPLLLPLLGGASAGSAVEEAERAGAGEMEQFAHGTISGVVEGIAERFGALPIIGRIVAGVPGAAADGIGKTVYRAMRGEFGEEAATSLLQEASRSGIITGFEDWNTVQALLGAVYEGALGGLSGGGAVLATSPFAQPPLEPEPEIPPPPPIDSDPTLQFPNVDTDQTLQTTVDLEGDYDLTLPLVGVDPDPTLAEATGRFSQEDMPTDPGMTFAGTLAEGAVPMMPPPEELGLTHPQLLDPNATQAEPELSQTVSTPIDPLAAAMDTTSGYAPGDQPAPPAAPPIEGMNDQTVGWRQGVAPIVEGKRDFADTWVFPNPLDQPAEQGARLAVEEGARRREQEAIEKGMPGAKRGRVFEQRPDAPPEEAKKAPPAAQAPPQEPTEAGFVSAPPEKAAAVSEAPAASVAPAPKPPPAAPAAAKPAAKPAEAPPSAKKAETTPPPAKPAEEASPKAEELYVPPEAAGIAARGIDVDVPEVKRILRKYGTSLGAWSKPSKMAIEAAKSERSATRGEAMELANALTRLQIQFQKDQHKKLESGKISRAAMISKSELDDRLTRYLEGETDVEIPDPKMVKVADRMRQIVTGLQTRQADILESEGKTELAETFRSNLGKRLTRSYRAFEDPEHIDKLKKSGEWETIKADIKALPEFAGKTDDEIEGEMVSMAHNDPMTLDLQKGGGQGTVYTGIFKQRQDLPEPVRRLLGEHKHATQKFFKTVDRLQRNVATHTLYSALKKQGLKEGWISEKQTGTTPLQIPGKDTRSPLGGMYISREMHDVLLATERQGSEHPAVRFFMSLTGAVKWNKTVGSVQSQARNFLGNGLLKSAAGEAGGRLLPWNRVKGAQKTGIARSIREAKSETGGGTIRALERAEEMGALGEMDLEQRRAAFNEAAKYGLVDTNPDVQDLKVFFGPDGPFSRHEAASESAGFRALKRTKGVAEFFYRMGDATYKIDAWYNEQNKIAYHSPEMSESKRKELAADRVKDMFPTSERQPEAIQIARRTPGVGGFISFISDIPRIAKNINKIAAQEINEGRKTGNKKMELVGWHRIGSFYGSGVLAAETLKLTLEMVRSALSDEDDKPSREEELMLRPMLPGYLSASRTPVLARGFGWAVVADLSFADPWASLKKPVTAFLRSLKYDGEGIDRAIWEAAKVAFEPYLQASPAAGPILEAFAGETRDGKVIWNEKEPPSTKIAKSIAHVTKRYEPGTLTTMRRLGEGAARGAKELAAEALAVVGPRLIFVDVAEKLPMVSYDYKRGQIDASSNYSRMFHPRFSDAERAKAKTDSINMYRASARDLVAAIETSKNLRWSKAQIAASLRASRVSSEVVSLAFRGEDAMVAWYERKLKEDERDLRAVLKQREKKKR